MISFPDENQFMTENPEYRYFKIQIYQKMPLENLPAIIALQSFHFFLLQINNALINFQKLVG